MNMTTEAKQFNFTAVLTVVVVVGYMMAAGVAYFRAGISWQDFSATAGPIAGTMLGYWFRGVKS